MNKFSLSIALGFALFALVLGIFILSQTSNTNLSTKTNARPTPLPRSIIPSLLPSTKNNLTNLSVVSAVTITFNTEIIPDSLSYTISPSIPLEIRPNKTNTQLSFLPKEYWKPKIVYTLTIKGLKNVTGILLPKTYQISFMADTTDDDSEIIINNPEVNNAP